jgi:hypothetical protein
MDKSESINRRINELEDSIKAVKMTGVKYTVNITGTRNCCKECYKLKNINIPFEEILQNPILPFHKCTRNPVCNCRYLFNLVRDELGKLIIVDY